MRHRLLLLGLCGLCACVLACDSANPVAPTGTVLSITANPTQISLSGGSSRITVTGFKPDGNPLNPGTQILVSTDLGNLYHASTGELVSIIEVTNNGQAVALLRGDGRAGPAMVTATLTTGGEVSATTMVQIGEAETSQPSLIISANPTIIPVRGRSEIRILARNSDNTPVGANQRIRLTADLGAVASAVLTNANGEAVTTYRAGDRAGTGGVTAILGTSEPATVQITIRDAPASLDFRADPLTVFRGGDRMITLTATVLNAQGDPVAAASVTFGADIGGTLQSGSGLNTTNPQGTAMDVLTVPEVELENRTSFEVSATVRGEGAEIRRTLTVTVLQQ